MNKREEDRMIEMVFGELNPNDASVLSHQVQTDEELAAFASEWEGLRDDLKSLKDIPEMQLSSERLRDAILGQGLRPEPAINWWNFAWVPVAACLALLIVLPSIKGNKSAPMIVMDDNLSRPTSVFGGGLKLELPKPKDFAISVPQPAAAGTNADPRKDIAVRSMRVALNEKALLTRKSLRSNGKSVQASLTSRSNSPRGTGMAFMKDSVAKAAITADSLISNDISTPNLETDTVVLIESSTDAATGANKATELAGISNVVVGG